MDDHYRASVGFRVCIPNRGDETIAKAIFRLDDLTVYVWFFCNVLVMHKSAWHIAAKNYTYSDWGIFWMFAIVSILIPQTAFASGLKLLNASTAGIVSILEPVIAIIAAFLILGESLNAVIQMFGGVLVIAAVGLLQAHPMVTKK